MKTLKTMNAARWYGPEDLRVDTIDIPTPGEGEVLVKIQSALTCGTDFKFFRRGHALLGKTVPSLFGHEMSGTITSIGKGVSQFKEGDDVVAANSAPCGHCFFCKKNQHNLCEHLEFLNGAFAEYILIPKRIVEKNLYLKPKNLSFRNAASTEPLASVARCAEQINIQPGEHVAIIGSGPTGLLWVQVAKHYGAKVVCLARNQQKLAMAKTLGADHTLSIKNIEALKTQVHEITQPGYGPDIVIDAAGQPETWEMAFNLVRAGGRVSFYGGCKLGTKITLDTHKLHYEELTLTGIFHHTPQYFEKLSISLLKAKLKLIP
ncbi:MAG: zinc-binding dehydrogenase [Deltaproteobacteria bacterium]|nr:MAG: zinc-binding dehydrogenase [Deltaproteobacteria bacterium]